MKEIQYPTLEEALYLHSVLIERFGGSTGVLDPGLLESALARPRSGYYKTLSEQAAALMQSLTKNHAFSDGNKRMALALTAIFLSMNGVELSCSADESERLILDIAENKLQTVDEISALIEKWMTFD